MHASIYGNMLKNALPLLITVENFDKNGRAVFVLRRFVLSDCEELGTAALNNFLPLLLEHDESTTKGMPRPLWKKAMKALHVATEKATLKPLLSLPAKKLAGIATLFGSLYDGKSDSFDDADCRGAILALQQLIKSPCAAGDAQLVDGVQWDAQKLYKPNQLGTCAKSKEGKTRTLLCTESFNVLLKESTSFAERQSTQTPADLAFAKAGIKAFYEMYDTEGATDEVGERRHMAPHNMTEIAKISRRWNATQTQRISEQDENYDEAEYIEQLKNWNAVLMQKTALQALVVVSRRGVSSLNLPTISSNNDISSKAVAKSDWSATADAFETVLGQNVEIMSSNDDNDDDQEAMLDEDEKEEDSRAKRAASVSEQAKKAKTFSDLTIASATALGEVVLRYSVTAEDGCILRFLRSLARGCPPSHRRCFGKLRTTV